MRRPRLRSPHDRDIFRLAVPSLGALIAQPLYIITDTAIVGNIGTEELAGLALASTVVLGLSTSTTIVFFVVFFVTGAVSAITRYFGVMVDYITLLPALSEGIRRKASPGFCNHCRAGLSGSCRPSSLSVCHSAYTAVDARQTNARSRIHPVSIDVVDTILITSDYPGI